MRNIYKILGSTACIALLANPVFAKEAPILKIENFIGTVDVVTGNYDKITITDADGVKYDARRDGVWVDGGYKINNAHCKTRRASVKIGIGSWKYLKRSGGYKDLSSYPKVKINAPENTHIIINKSVIFGDVDTVGSADIHIASCGNMQFGNVNGQLDLSISGSGDVKMGNVGPSDITVSGAGDFTAQNVASAHIHVSGSGDLELGDIAGFADVNASGAGDLDIGHIGGGLHYEGSGASDFEIQSVSGGDLYIRASGSGDVIIGGGDVGELEIRASGASDVVYKGRSKNAEARASGASDVTIHRPSGDLHTSDSGAGDVHVRNGG